MSDIVISICRFKDREEEDRSALRMSFSASQKLNVLWFFSDGSTPSLRVVLGFILPLSAEINTHQLPLFALKQTHI